MLYLCVVIRHQNYFEDVLLQVRKQALTEDKGGQALSFRRQLFCFY